MKTLPYNDLLPPPFSKHMCMFYLVLSVLRHLSLYTCNAQKVQLTADGVGGC